MKVSSQSIADAVMFYGAIINSSTPEELQAGLIMSYDKEKGISILLPHSSKIRNDVIARLMANCNGVVLKRDKSGVCIWFTY